MIQGTAVPLVFHDAVGRDCTQCYIFLKKVMSGKFFYFNRVNIFTEACKMLPS